MLPALAALPIAIVLAAMIGLRWSAAHAGLAGLMAATALVVAGVGPEATAARQLGQAVAISGAMVEALFTTATILWIIFPALCIYELQLRTGAFDALRAGMSSLAGDRRTQVLLVAWFFGLFMEGAAGFGTPVALAAPLLAGLGVPPVRSVALALIGHAAGVSFGAVGTPIQPQLAATGLLALELSATTALFHALLGFLVRLASTRRPTPQDWLWAFAAGACFLLPYLLFAAVIGPELPTLGGALVGGLLFMSLRGALRGRRDGAPINRAAVLKASAPYLLLLLLVLATRLVPPVRDALVAIDWRWSLAGWFSGVTHPLYHPGTLLMLAFLLTILVQRRPAADLGRSALAAARRLAPVTVALVAMLGLSRLMVHAGLVTSLAEAAASTGALWPLLAPAVGVLGTFVTGSATASNILFTDFQATTAARLDMPLVPLVAAQGFGAAVGNIICPHNIVAGGATVGIAGREGEVMRSTALACAIYALAGGVLALLLVG